MICMHGTKHEYEAKGTVQILKDWYQFQYASFALEISVSGVVKVV